MTHKYFDESRLWMDSMFVCTCVTGIGSTRIAHINDAVHDIYKTMFTLIPFGTDALLFLISIRSLLVVLSGLCTIYYA